MLLKSHTQQKNSEDCNKSLSENQVLEIILQKDVVYQFELTEYQENKFILSTKNDYICLQDSLIKWLIENGEKTDKDYINWVNEIKYNFYQGFNDSMSDIKIKQHDRESEFEIESKYDEISYFIDMPDLVDNKLVITNEKINDINQKLANQKIQAENAQNEIEIDLSEDIPKKKKHKKRRTRKDRREKEQISTEWMKLKMVDGTYYGQFKEGKRHGQGEFEYSDKGFYKGGWETNQRHHFGEMKYSDGTVYSGNWDQGTREGTGKCTGPNGTCYDGQWVSNKMSGKGILTFKNRACYNGDFQDNKFHGKGIFINQKGEKYIGEYMNGIKNGMGKFVESAGGSYIGQFYNEFYHGQGTFIYPNGEVYKGLWKNGLRHGQGCLAYVNGSSYNGGWKNGVKDGQGEYRYENGKTHECFWDDDNLIDGVHQDDLIDQKKMF